MLHPLSCLAAVSGCFDVRSWVMLGASLFRVSTPSRFSIFLLRLGALMNAALQDFGGGNEGAAIANFGTMVFQGNTVFRDTPDVSAASASACLAVGG